MHTQARNTLDTDAVPDTSVTGQPAQARWTDWPWRVYFTGMVLILADLGMHGNL